jgi:ATP-dependent DNA helicase RecG
MTVGDPAPATPGRGGRTYRFLAGQPVATLKSLSARKAAALNEWGVESILDLVTTYPHRYIDRTRQVAVADVIGSWTADGPGRGSGGGGGSSGVAGEVVVLAEVRRASLRGGYGGPRAGGSRAGGRGRGRVEVDVFDSTGTLRVVFFNQPWRAKQLSAGTVALYSGKVTDYRGGRQMVNPAVDVLVDGGDRADGSDSSDSSGGSGGPDGSDGSDGSPVSGGPAAPAGALEAYRRRTLRIVPVYPQSAKSGLNSAEIGAWVAEALDRAGRFADPLPERWRTDLGLLDRSSALRGIHLPDSMADWPAARRRLAFDELFRLQLALVLRRRALEHDARAIRHTVSVLDVTDPIESPGDGGGRGGGQGTFGHSLVREFLESLPFELTRAQRRALAAIFAELAGPLPMHRLLQGDVGSGKTVVAVAAMLAAVQGGHQGALMVPTEVLAEQHFMAVRSLLDGLTIADASRLGGRRPVEVALLTNRTTAAERARLYGGLRSGDVDLIVGTHALLTDEVRFHSLGVVVIDEQHRFGVEQRAALREKGRASLVAAPAGDGSGPPAAGGPGGADPDLLVMTATPIPRTAAMVLFGDLDMVVLDELPPGRTPVETIWARTPLEEAAAWERVRSEVSAGHRAFVVCPLVEGSERVEARSATEERERLATGPLEGYRVGLLHGQMASSDKEQAMAAFRAGETDVLVATTVVEVGVDVPEATVMVVEDAERFGISQLHQLRGRVGRSHRPSWCYLLGEAPGPDAAQRLEALVATADGFELAEVDLEIRGEGTILGSRQKGRSDLKLARLRRDGDLLAAARRVAEDVVAPDAALGGYPLLDDEIRLFLDPEEEEYLFKS